MKQTDPVTPDPWERVKQMRFRSGARMTPAEKQALWAAVQEARARSPKRSWSEFKAPAAGLADPLTPALLRQERALDLVEALAELLEPEVAAALALELAADHELRRQIEEARDRLIALIEEAKG
jgi:hypothetical protein